MWKENWIIYENQMRLSFPGGLYPLAINTAEGRTAGLQQTNASSPLMTPGGLTAAATPTRAVTFVPKHIMAVNTIDGPKAVVPFNQIKTWIQMCPELDKYYNFATDMRHAIRAIDPAITSKVALFTGDLVTLEVDVIVNSTSRE